MQTHKNEEKSSKKKRFPVIVDGSKLIFEKPKVTGEEILVKACKTPKECFTVYQKFKGCDFERIEHNQIVDLATKGLEKFLIKKSETSHYTLDDEPESTDRKSLSANQILENGGIKPVADYYLMEIESDGNEISHKNAPDVPIEMKCPGSKFVSIFRGAMPVS